MKPLVDDPKKCAKTGGRHKAMRYEDTDEYGNKLVYPICSVCKHRLPARV